MDSGSGLGFPVFDSTSLLLQPTHNGLDALHPIHQLGLPSALPSARPSFLVILRVGLGSVPWGAGLLREPPAAGLGLWRGWGRHSQLCFLGPCCLPSSLVLRRPSPGCLLLQCQGCRRGSHQPVPLPGRNKDTASQKDAGVPVARALPSVGPDWPCRLQGTEDEPGLLPGPQMS